jgi:hypothetical protein
MNRNTPIGSTAAEALQTIFQLFSQPGVRPPFREIYVLDWATGGIDDLLPSLGVRPSDLRLWNHPYPLWVEFRQLVPCAPRLGVGVLTGADAPHDPRFPAFIVDSQLLDKAFRRMEALQTRVQRGRARP